MNSSIYKHRIVLLVTVLLGVFALASCKNNDPVFDDIVGYNQGLLEILNPSLYTEKVGNVFTDDEEDDVDSTLNDFKEANTAIVELDDENTIIQNDLANTEIYMEDGNLIVHSSIKLTLILRGTLNGNVSIFKTDGKLKLVLDGVDITANQGPAINLQTDKRVFLVTNSGTENNLTDGLLHPLMMNGSKTKAALFSEEQLILSGSGVLNITGLYKHGITSDDYIKIQSGTINILSSESDGLHANDAIIIDGGDVTINAGKDGIDCERGYIVINGGSVSITSGNDGITTTYNDEDTTITSFIQINNGLISIFVPAEGIKSMSDIVLNQAAIIIVSTDDSLSAVGEIRIEDGLYSFHSLEKQALDGDIDVIIEGGILVLLGDGDTDVVESDDGDIQFNGGTIVAAGSGDLKLSQSTQGLLRVGSVVANTTLNIRDNSSILMVAFLKPYEHVILSSPDMTVGTSLEVHSGGTATGNNFYGLYVSGSYINDKSVVVLEVE